MSRFSLSASQSTAGWNFRRFVLGQNGFAAVVFPSSSSENATLVNANLDGKTISTVDLGSDEFSDCAYYNGAVWVLSAPIQGGVRIRRFDPSGGEADYQPSDRGLFRLGATEAGLYGLTRSGLLIPISDETVVRDPIQLSSGDFSNPELSLLIGVGHDLLAVIDRVEVRATIVDLSTRKQSVIQLPRQEIEAVKNAYKEQTKGTNIKGLAVQTATGANQKLFLMLSGFKAAEGAPVLVVDRSGTVDQVYRIPMRNGALQDVPESIQIRGGALFVLNDAGKVSKYQIKKVDQRN